MEDRYRARGRRARGELQEDILKLLRRVFPRGRGVRELMKLTGHEKSPGPVQYALKALEKKGLVDHGEDRLWYITTKGMESLVGTPFWFAHLVNSNEPDLLKTFVKGIEEASNLEELKKVLLDENGFLRLLKVIINYPIG